MMSNHNIISNNEISFSFVYDNLKKGDLSVISEKIRLLREQNNITQSALARELGVTRSAVNAWEMGISVPSTFLIVEIANFFHISTDYLLGIHQTSSLDVSGLNDKEIMLIRNLIEYFKSLKTES